MAHPRFELAVVLEKRILANRWQSVQWVPSELRLGSHGDRALLLSLSAESEKWLFPGFWLQFYTDEAEGYFLNLSAAQPFVFVMWRMEGEMAIPHSVSASYNEASRWLDAGEAVEGLPMPEEIRIAAGAFTLNFYRPEPKRARPPSFQGARRSE
ncbi:MAG TPA: DUF3305 domain-containing protein [Burkholderiales bacterium]|nr:DUF3305 domain-containing protein [Burkholderiales bacterium]